MRRLTLVLLLATLLSTTSTHAAPEQSEPAIAIDPVVGPPGTEVGYKGVGFTPGGRVAMLLDAGLSLIVSDVVASPKGTIEGSFRMPASGPAGELASGGQEVFAIDHASGRETLLAPFLLTRESAREYDLPNGRFFTQTNGQAGADGTGYAVLNTQPFAVFVPFWDELEQLEGIAKVGYPVSRAFVRDGFVTQAFQKAVLQWQPEEDRVSFLSVFDILHEGEHDPYLLVVRSVPQQLPDDFDGGKTPRQVVDDRLALLQANEVIRSMYFSVDDPLSWFGLPTSRVEDMGSHFAIRLQRAVIQQWKVDTPWASAGEATIANGGDIFKELKQLPAFSVVSENPPSFSRSILVDYPPRGDELRSPIRLIGHAQAFEGTVSFELLDELGTVLVRGSAQARVGGPFFGRFEASVPFGVRRRQPGILRVFTVSARDGDVFRDSVVPIAVTLVPENDVDQGPRPTAGWKSYSSAAYKVALQYPPLWREDTRYGTSGDPRYSGGDGFVQLSALSADSIDSAAESLANHQLRPYGSRPSIVTTHVGGQEARLILPSGDQEPTQDQAAVIVRYPEAVEIAGTSYEYLVLWADTDHIQAIAETLRFGTSGPAGSGGPGLWP